MAKDITQAFDTSEDKNGRERRLLPRHSVRLNVNYTHGDTYLFSRSSNLSEMGIFLVTDTPLAAGTRIELRFNTAHGTEPIEVTGEVVWIDPGTKGSEPGMGLRFVDPGEETKQRIKTLIRTIAYLD